MDSQHHRVAFPPTGSVQKVKVTSAGTAFARSRIEDEYLEMHSPFTLVTDGQDST